MKKLILLLLISGNFAINPAAQQDFSLVFDNAKYIITTQPLLTPNEESRFVVNLPKEMTWLKDPMKIALSFAYVPFKKLPGKEVTSEKKANTIFSIESDKIEFGSPVVKSYVNGNSVLYYHEWTLNLPLFLRITDNLSQKKYSVPLFEKDEFFVDQLGKTSITLSRQSGEPRPMVGFESEESLAAYYKANEAAIKAYLENEVLTFSSKRLMVMLDVLFTGLKTSNNWKVSRLKNTRKGEHDFSDLDSAAKLLTEGISLFAEKPNEAKGWEPKFTDAGQIIKVFSASNPAIASSKQMKKLEMLNLSIAALLTGDKKEYLKHKAAINADNRGVVDWDEKALNEIDNILRCLRLAGNAVKAG